MRRKLALAASLAAAGILAISSVAAGATKTVDVDDNFFDPDVMKIKKNDKVAFNWIGVEEHDVALGKGPGKFFNSGPTAEPGVNFTKKFKKPGDYKLICTLHSEMTMKLKVKK
jgi:plastocyanin